MASHCSRLVSWNSSTRMWVRLGPQAAKRFGNAIVARQHLTGQTGDEGGGNGPFALEEVGNLTGEFPRQFHKRHDRLGPAEQHAVLVPFPDDVPHGVESPFRVGDALPLDALFRQSSRQALRSMAEFGGRFAGAAFRHVSRALARCAEQESFSSASR